MAELASVSEALKRAIQHHKNDDLDAAAEIYRRILNVDNENADALNLLGVVLHQKGDHEAAISYIRKSIQISSDSPSYYNNLGEATQAAGRTDEAIEYFEKALAISPNYVMALSNVGNALQAKGEYNHAIQKYKKAIENDPDNARVRNNYAAALYQKGELENATTQCEFALKIAPDCPEAHNQLGMIKKDRGDLKGALKHYEQALRMKPKSFVTLNNLGNALSDLGKFDEAVDHFVAALRENPSSAAAFNNLGIVLQSLGRHSLAIESFEKAIKHDPNHAEAYSNLGNSLKQLGKLDEAIEKYQAALRINPNMAVAHINLGNGFVRQERLEEAAKCFLHAQQLDPDQISCELREAALCPSVFENPEQIDGYRESVKQKLNEFRSNNVNETFSVNQFFGSEPSFNLMYHGRDDRPLKEQYGELFSSVLKQATVAKPQNRRSGRLHKIGFVVTKGHEGVFIRLFQENLERFNRELFELFVICSYTGASRMRQVFRSNSVQILTIPDDFNQMVETIQIEGFDIIYFWEVGSDEINYFLPFARLAPIQCTSWAIQVSSGIPLVDYYISSSLIETEDAQSHYSEKLILLETLMTFQKRVSVPEPLKKREDFGFSQDQNLYLAIHNLRKFHPDYDSTLREILRRDPKGYIILTEDDHGIVANKLKQRLINNLGDEAERVVFLPRQNRDDYLNLLYLGDVVLDPLYYGGVNTTYDAFSFGKPIIVQPTQFQIGRYTYGCYQKIGVLDCIAENAEEYIQLAVYYGTNPVARNELQKTILEATDQIFEDEQAVREHERVFQSMIEKEV